MDTLVCAVVGVVFGVCAEIGDGGRAAAYSASTAANRDGAGAGGVIIGAEVGGAVFAQTARDVDPRIFFGRQFDVRISLVVAQQDVEARLVLLDEVVFERQRFLLVIDLDVLDVARLGDERAGLDVGQLVFREVAADAVAQDLSLAHVDDAAGAVLI